jgi:hypothetical protein
VSEILECLDRIGEKVKRTNNIMRLSALEDKIIKLRDAHIDLLSLEESAEGHAIIEKCNALYIRIGKQPVE